MRFNTYKEPELKPDKGHYNGSCNRKDCQKPGADWYNHSTRAYYCSGCAGTINLYNRKDALEMYGHDLCTKGIPQKP